MTFVLGTHRIILFITFFKNLMSVYIHTTCFEERANTDFQSWGKSWWFSSYQGLWEL